MQKSFGRLVEALSGEGEFAARGHFDEARLQDVLQNG
jgi:hypothetical protein